MEACLLLIENVCDAQKHEVFTPKERKAVNRAVWSTVKAQPDCPKRKKLLQRMRGNHPPNLKSKKTLRLWLKETANELSDEETIELLDDDAGPIADKEEEEEDTIKSVFDDGIYKNFLDATPTVKEKFVVNIVAGPDKFRLKEEELEQEINDSFFVSGGGALPNTVVHLVIEGDDFTKYKKQVTSADDGTWSFSQRITLGRFKSSGPFIQIGVGALGALGQQPLWMLRRYIRFEQLYVSIFNRGVFGAYGDAPEDFKNKFTVNAEKVMVEDDDDGEIIGGQPFWSGNYRISGRGALPATQLQFVGEGDDNKPFKMTVKSRANGSWTFRSQVKSEDFDPEEPEIAFRIATPTTPGGEPQWVYNGILEIGGDDDDDEEDFIISDGETEEETSDGEDLTELSDEEELPDADQVMDDFLDDDDDEILPPLPQPGTNRSVGIFGQTFISRVDETLPQIVNGVRSLLMSHFSTILCIVSGGRMYFINTRDPKAHQFSKSSSIEFPGDTRAVDFFFDASVLGKNVPFVEKTKSGLSYAAGIINETAHSRLARGEMESGSGELVIVLNNGKFIVVDNIPGRTSNYPDNTSTKVKDFLEIVKGYDFKSANVQAPRNAEKFRKSMEAMLLSVNSGTVKYSQSGTYALIRRLTVFNKYRGEGNIIPPYNTNNEVGLISTVFEASSNKKKTFSHGKLKHESFFSYFIDAVEDANGQLVPVLRNRRVYEKGTLLAGDGKPLTLIGEGLADSPLIKRPASIGKRDNDLSQMIRGVSFFSYSLVGGFFVVADNGRVPKFHIHVVPQRDYAANGGGIFTLSEEHSRVISGMSSGNNSLLAILRGKRPSPTDILEVEVDEQQDKPSPKKPKREEPKATGHHIKRFAPHCYSSSPTCKKNITYMRLRCKDSTYTERMFRFLQKCVKSLRTRRNKGVSCEYAQRKITLRLVGLIRNHPVERTQRCMRKAITKRPLRWSEVEFDNWCGEFFCNTASYQ